MKVNYIPPVTGGEVVLTLSPELAQLFGGFIGGVSLSNLHGLDHAQEVRDEISEVIAPDPRPGRGYGTGEGQWIVSTVNGSLLSVPTRRIPEYLRWPRERASAYIDLFFEW